MRLLSHEQQWALHDFYLLAHDLPRSEILMQREEAIRADSVLVKNAGFAYRPFAALARRGGRIVARTDPRPSTDFRLPAEALILHAQQTAERDQTNAEDSDR